MICIHALISCKDATHTRCRSLGGMTRNSKPGPDSSDSRVPDRGAHVGGMQRRPELVARLSKSMQADHTGGSVAGSMHRHGSSSCGPPPSPHPTRNPEPHHCALRNGLYTVANAFVCAAGECTSRALLPKPQAQPVFARRTLVVSVPALDPPSATLLSDGQKSGGAAPIGSDAAASPQRLQAGSGFALPCGFLGARRRVVSLARNRPAHPGQQHAASGDATGRCERISVQQDFADSPVLHAPGCLAGECTEQQVGSGACTGAQLKKKRAAAHAASEVENREPEPLMTPVAQPFMGCAPSRRTLQTAGDALQESTGLQGHSSRSPSNASAKADAAAKQLPAGSDQPNRHPVPKKILPAAADGSMSHRRQLAAESELPAPLRKRVPPRRKRLREIKLSSSSDDGESDCRSGSAAERCEPARRTRRKVCTRSGSHAVPAHHVQAESQSPPDVGPDSSGAAPAAAADDDSSSSCADSEHGDTAPRTKQCASKRAWNRDRNPTVAELRQRCGPSQPDLPVVLASTPAA